MELAAGCVERFYAVPGDGGHLIRRWRTVPEHSDASESMIAQTLRHDYRWSNRCQKSLEIDLDTFGYGEHCGIVDGPVEDGVGDAPAAQIGMPVADR